LRYYHAHGNMVFWRKVVSRPAYVAMPLPPTTDRQEKKQGESTMSHPLGVLSHRLDAFARYEEGQAAMRRGHALAERAKAAETQGDYVTAAFLLAQVAEHLDETASIAVTLAAMTQDAVSVLSRSAQRSEHDQEVQRWQRRRDACRRDARRARDAADALAALVTAPHTPTGPRHPVAA
jgi:hypothetical protein